MSSPPSTRAAPGHVTLYVRHVTCQRGKKVFPLQFCEICLFQITWNTTLCGFFFSNFQMFPSFFSIRNLDLCDFKVNGNAPAEAERVN